MSTALQPVLVAPSASRWRSGRFRRAVGACGVFAGAVAASWFVLAHRGEVSGLVSALRATSPFDWLVGLALAAMLAVTTGGTYLHALGLVDVRTSLARATRLSLSGHLLATVVPSGGLAAVPIFVSEAKRTSGAASAGAAGWLVATLVGRVGLEAAVVVALLTHGVVGVPLRIVVVALALHALSTAVKLGTIAASRRHVPAVAHWASRVLRRFGWVPAGNPQSAAVSEVAEQLGALRWRRRHLVPALVWSLAGKVVGGGLIAAAAHAAGGSIGIPTGVAVYVIATMVGAVSFLPAGLGAVDVAIGHALIGSGMSLAQATTAVVFYRLFQLWLPLAVGAAVMVVGRRGLGDVARRRSLAIPRPGLAGAVSAVEGPRLARSAGRFCRQIAGLTPGSHDGVLYCGVSTESSVDHPQGALQMEQTEVQPVPKPKPQKARKRLITGALVAGALLGSAGIAAAQTGATTTPPAAATGADGSQTAKATSNEDPTHEAGETAAQEAAEDAGRGHGGRHGTNEDPAHEASETPEREAAEHAAAGSATTPTTPSSTASSSSGA